MKNLLTQNGALMPSRQTQNVGILCLMRYMAVAVFAFVGLLAFARPSHAVEGYRVTITAANDPTTGNSRVRIGGYRGLTAHVTRTPSGANASGVTVYFYTNRGTLSSAQENTDGSGNAGVTLGGGWVAGTATATARVVGTNGTQYNSTPSASVEIVKPDGENTGFVQWGTGTTGREATGVWNARLTPTDVNFDGLQVTERDGGVVGAGDTCWYAGNDWNYTPFQAVTGAGTPFGTVHSHNWWGHDGVGYSTSMVTNYRAGPGPTPCGTHFKQHMDVIVPGSNNVYYTSNILGAGIQPTTVTSARDGQSQQRSWP